MLSAVDPEDNEYDLELIRHINTAFAYLTEAGAGPARGFVVSGYDERWGDFVENAAHLSQIIDYVMTYVRIYFSPPDNASLVNVMQDHLKDLLCLVNHRSEYYSLDDEEEDLDEELYRKERRSVWEQAKTIYQPTTS